MKKMLIALTAGLAICTIWARAIDDVRFIMDVRGDWRKGRMDLH